MSSPYDLVRVSDPVSRAHVTVTRGVAEAAGLRVLKSPAVDAYGVPLPAKPYVDRRADTKPDTGADAGKE